MAIDYLVTTLNKGNEDRCVNGVIALTLGIMGALNWYIHMMRERLIAQLI